MATSGKLFQPRPDNWTIRFKHGKSTLLLHVNPDQSMDSVKRALLQSLSELPETSQLLVAFGGTVPTSNPSDIIFGLPVDPSNPESGWKPLDPADSPDDMMQDDNHKTGDAESAILRGSPRAAGLKDGRVLAFTFRSLGGKAPTLKGDWGVQLPEMFEDEEEDEGAEGSKPA